jgi:hypothetical protein
MVSITFSNIYKIASVTIAKIDSRKEELVKEIHESSTIKTICEGGVFDGSEFTIRISNRVFAGN